MVHYICQYVKAIDYFKHSQIKNPTSNWQFGISQAARRHQKPAA